MTVPFSHPGYGPEKNTSDPLLHFGIFKKMFSVDIEVFGVSTLRKGRSVNEIV